MNAVFGPRAVACDQSTSSPLEGTVEIVASGPSCTPPPAVGASVVWVSELHVPPAAGSAARARQFVRCYCQDQGLPDLADDVQLVVSELVTNAVVHARTRIRVRIEMLPSCVKLTVYDQAVDRPVPSLARRVLDEDECGRGLWLVDACTADWGTDVTSEEGKSTWALFTVSASPSELRAAGDHLPGA